MELWRVSFSRDLIGLILGFAFVVLVQWLMNSGASQYIFSSKQN